ncbi:MAG: HIRAN domain-containing protein [Rhodospirillaceae bacterium]
MENWIECVAEPSSLFLAWFGGLWRLSNVPEQSMPCATSAPGLNLRRSTAVTLIRKALLGLTESKLPSDGFSIVDPLNPDTECCDLMLEIAGFRYYVEIEPLGVGVGYPVEILGEPDNTKDPNAVKICVGGRKIGNVNRPQTAALRSWLVGRQVSAVIERLNGNAKKPRAFIFVRVRARSVSLAA